MGLAPGRFLISLVKTVGFTLAVAITTSCSDDPMPYQTSSELSERLLEFSQQGPQHAVRPLNEMTHFDWDTVFIFYEGTLKKVVNDRTGLTVFEDDEGRYYERGALLVFKKGDQNVHSLAIIPPLFVSGRAPKAHQHADAKLVARSKNPGPYLLRFLD